MMTGPSVTLVPADRVGCGHYRMLLPAAAASGCDVEVVESLEITWVRAEDGWQAERVHVDADVVVLQRPATPELCAAMQRLQRQGTAVVVEVDDDLWSVPTANASGDFWHTRKHLLTAAVKMADRVTVTTRPLAERVADLAGHDRVSVVPNAVDPDDVDPNRGPKDDPPTVGWGGWVGTHPNDLQTTGGRVARATADAGGQVVAIGGDSDDALARLGATVGDARPAVPLDGWLDALAGLTVGIVPLATDRFNRSKSALKMVEYAAAGVWPVASPTPANRLAAGCGVGEVVGRSGAGWYDRIRHWLEHPGQAAEAGRRAAEAVAEWYTTDVTGPSWESAWTAAAERRADRTVPV